MDPDPAERPEDNSSSDESITQPNGNPLTLSTSRGIVFTCAICGETIGDYCRPEEEPCSPWLGEFRAILPDQREEEEEHDNDDDNSSLSNQGDEDKILTGVGYVPPNAPSGPLFAPADPNARWDDRKLGKTLRLTPMQILPNLRGNLTYLVHNACWMLLEREYRPNAVPISKFWDVCLQLPVEGEAHPLRYWALSLKWPHNYGGMSETAREQPYRRRWPKTFSSHRVSGTDPATIPSVQQVMADVAAQIEPFPSSTLTAPVPYKVDPPAVKAKSKTRLTDPYTDIDSDDESDCSIESFVTACATVDQARTRHAGGDGPDLFLRLPPELRVMITFYLTLPSVKLLRCASRAFWFLFHDNHFWMSRLLDEGGERVWLREARESSEYLNSSSPEEMCTCFPSPNNTDVATSGSSRGWRELYWLTGGNKVPAAWKNRRRVWKRVRGLKWLIALRLAPSLPLPVWVLKEMLGGRWKDMNSFKCGSVLYRSIQSLIAIPGRLIRLEFLFIGLGKEKYLAGIKLFGRDGGYAEAGLQPADDNWRWGGYGTRHGLNIPRRKIRGFVVAADKVGIRALSVVFDGDLNGEMASEMVGQWDLDDGCPVTWRLVCAVPTEVLKVRVGPGWRLNCLSVFEYEVASKDHLYNSALWSPSRFGRGSQLNIQPFHRRTMANLVHGDQPVFVAYFGGPRGKYLRNVTKMVVQFAQWGIKSIDFHYNKFVAPRWSHIGEKSSKYNHTKGFTIDGPGGEFISAIEIRTTNQNGPRPGPPKLESLKVFTNRGRSCVWDYELAVPDKTAHRPMLGQRELLKPYAGTRITGILAYDNRIFHIMPLGLLSCEVNDKGLDTEEVNLEGPVGDDLQSLINKLEAVKVAQSDGERGPTS